MAKFIFIGLDGSFKTTVATLLHQYLDIPYVKLSQSKDVEEVVSVVTDLATDQNFYDSVIDRIKSIDHMVYETVIGGVSFTPQEYASMMNVHGLVESFSDKVYYIFMYGEPSILWQRLNKRGDEDYVKRLHVLDDLMHQYRVVMDMYRARGLMAEEDTLEIDTSNITSDEAFRLIKETFDL